MTQEEFQYIMTLKWSPVKFGEETTLPNWIKEIPAEQRSYVYASGSNVETRLDKDGRCIVGGIDILRPAITHPEHVNWSRDHYIIIQSTDNSDKLLVEYVPSTKKDSEHNLNNIPERLKNAKVYIYSGSQKDE
jgi:hypothetical protein